MEPPESSNKYPLHIPRGLITRAKASRMKEALTTLIEGIQRQQAKEEVQGKLLHVQEDLQFVNMICASPIKDKIEQNWRRLANLLETVNQKRLTTLSKGFTLQRIATRPHLGSAPLQHPVIVPSLGFITHFWPSGRLRVTSFGFYLLNDIFILIRVLLSIFKLG